jgi:hypothetical protein
MNTFGLGSFRKACKGANVIPVAGTNRNAPDVPAKPIQLSCGHHLRNEAFPGGNGDRISL